MIIASTLHRALAHLVQQAGSAEVLLVAADHMQEAATELRLDGHAAPDLEDLIESARRRADLLSQQPQTQQAGHDDRP